MAHSKDFFGDERDFWWHHDYLALIARRLELDGVRRVLDVGCGLGHWTRALARHLPKDAQIDGVDADATWVARAAEWSRGRVQLANAEELPFSDGEFDLVTCQTLLIHVRDCSTALGEMHRVLAPGGRLLAVEPNNLANALVAANTNFERVEERLELARFQALCERGKARLDEGHNSVGDLIPGMAAQAGFERVQVYVADRASTLIPPYDQPDERAIVAQVRELVAREMWIWPREQTEKYFLAGGGAAENFADLWQRALAQGQEAARELDAGRLHTAGGNLTYVICARKPANGESSRPGDR